jgi:hypothetical protein
MSCDEVLLFFYFFSCSFCHKYCNFIGRYDKGAYLFLPSYVMRIHGAKQQRDAVKRAPKNQLDPVFEVGIFCNVCAFASQFMVPS